MRIGIVGLGLIGGSLGLALRALGHQVYGIARHPDTCVAAVTLGAVDSAASDLASLAPVDMVMVCTPIAAIAPTVQALVPHLSPETVVTDVGSVKGDLVQAATAHWPWFVGAHPMAGKAEAGLAAAAANLFMDRAYVITPLPETPPAAIARVQDLAQSLRAKVLTCSPSDHDCAVAWISHLPVMVSSSLIQACLQESDKTVLKLAQTLSSSGFASTSRVGGGNPELGLMMARYNREALLRSLQGYQTQLAAITHLVETEQWSALAATLTASQQARPQFL